MISVLTWDAGFRESFHTIACFREQTLEAREYEFIWMDYYSILDDRVHKELEEFPNGRATGLGMDGDWHLGRAINSEINKAKGDLLVIVDGDIVASTEFLSQLRPEFESNENLVVYCRRWDEPQPADEIPTMDRSVDYLKNVCTLTNPTNYGGCVALHKSLFVAVGGYEEHELFSGAGAIGLEFYTRLKNYGAQIKWHPQIRVFHPWHRGSIPSSLDYVSKTKLQFEYIKQRDLAVRSTANDRQGKLLADSLMSRQLEQADAGKRRNWISSTLKRFAGNP